MAFRSQSFSGPRPNRPHEAVGPSGEGHRHYGEGRPTTFNSGPALPKFSSAVSSGRFGSPHTGDKGMTERAEKQPPQRNVFTSLSTVGSSPTAGSSLTSPRSQESRNPPAEHRRGRSGGGEGYDDFSAKVREEMRKVQAEMHGGRSVGHPPRPFSRHQTSGPPPPRAVASPRSQNKALLERNKVLERDLATKDREIVALHGERLGGEQDYRHVRGEKERLEARNRDLERAFSERDSEVRELTRQLNSMKEAASEKDMFASSKDRMAQDYAKDMQALRSECERALEQAVKENDALQKDQANAAKENDALRKDLDALEKDLDSARKENDALQKDLKREREGNDALQKDLQSARKNLASAEGGINLLRKDLSMAKDECAVLQEDLQATRGEAIAVREDLNATRGEADGLGKDLAIAREEADLLQKKLETSHKVIDDLQDQCDDNRDLRNDYEMLQNENETLKEMANTAQKDVELRQRAMKELETDYVTLTEEKNRLESVADDLVSLEAEYEALTKAKMDLEPMTQEMEKMEARHEEVLEENKRLETMLADKKGNYHHLLEEKIRMERANQELKEELRCTREDYDMVKNRLRLLDEMTDALEASLDEKQAAIAEKEDVVVRYNTLQDDYTALQNTIDTERESMAYEFESTRKTIAFEFESTKKSMAHELESTKKSMTQDLNAALARKDEAIDQFKDLTKEHDRLKEELMVKNKELNKLQVTKGSSAHVTEMVTRQRDKLNVMVERYQDEIEELKRENMDLQGQRDDLKKELICVLETASEYQD